MTDNLHATPPTASTTGPGMRVAFYGRSATEDNQDVTTAQGWQRHAAETLLSTVTPGATIVADYFDAGQAKSLPLADRTEASRLLTDLANPNRGWEAIVVGEGNRCWVGTQFSDLATLVGHHGVDLYVPELSGRYDPNNPAHHTLMTIASGMSLGNR